MAEESLLRKQITNVVYICIFLIFAYLTTGLYQIGCLIVAFGSIIYAITAQMKKPNPILNILIGLSTSFACAFTGVLVYQNNWSDQLALVGKISIYTFSGIFFLGAVLALIFSLCLILKNIAKS